MSRDSNEKRYLTYFNSELGGITINYPNGWIVDGGPGKDSFVAIRPSEFVKDLIKSPILIRIDFYQAEKSLGEYIL